MAWDDILIGSEQYNGVRCLLQDGHLFVEGRETGRGAATHILSVWRDGVEYEVEPEVVAKSTTGRHFVESVPVCDGDRVVIYDRTNSGKVMYFYVEI